MGARPRGYIVVTRFEYFMYVYVKPLVPYFLTMLWGIVIGIILAFWWTAGDRRACPS